MELIAIKYPERRLEFFREQLAAAHRRLDWSMKHNPDWNDHAEKGEVVSYYEWAAQMAEAEVEPVKRGVWLPQTLLGQRVWDCSECKTLGSPHWKRCPVCEAKMEVADG